MKKYRAKRAGGRRVVSAFSLILIVAGLGLVGYFLLSQFSPLLGTLDIATKDDEPAADIRDTNLKLTVPKMDRVKDLNVYTGPGDEESALEKGALHIQGTGFPWEQQPNVYIAGHRLGYPGTDSYLVFWDLDKLEQGDEVILTDANGTSYIYRVFNSFVADPYDWHVTKPIPGKNILSLQNCTLPDYTRRIVVQAELVKTA